jgi:hypothetical protein
MIRWIINHLLFAGTFFAAGAPAIGGGAAVATPGTTGGESSGGAADAGSGGGKVIPSTEGGTDGTETVEAADEFGSFDDFDSEAANQDNAVLDAGDADEFGPNTYKTVKEALKANPEVFKQVKKAVSMVKRYQEHFDSPEAAGELLTDIQTLGGWDSVKQEMGETATFLNGWNAGDGDVVSKWLDDNGDGLTKNMPTILDRWQKADPQGWAHDAAGTFMATMMQQDESGMSPMLALTKLGEMEGVKDSAEFKAVMRVIKGVQATAKNAPAKPAAKGPDETKLSQREQQIKQQEWNLQRQALAGKATPILSTAAENALKLVAGSRKLSPQTKTDILNDIQSAFAKVVEKRDPDGKAKRQKLLAAGQHDQWLKMSKAVAERLMPEAARLVWRKYAGISGLSTQQKQERRAEGQQRQESGTGAVSAGLPENKAPEYDGQGRTLVDKDAMIRMFGSRSDADDAFLWGSKKHGGKKVWIRKGDGKLFTY